MPLNNAIKLQISNVIKNNSLNDIYYSDFQSIKKAARVKVNDNDILKYLSKKSIDELAKKESLSVNRFPKLIESILIIITNEPLDEETIEILNRLHLISNEYLQSIQKKPEELVEQKIREFDQLMKDYNLERTIEPEDISLESSSMEKSIKLIEKLEQLQTTKETLEQKVTELEKAYSRTRKSLEKMETKSARLEKDKKDLQTLNLSLHEKVKSQGQQAHNLEMEKKSLQQENQHLNIAIKTQIENLAKLSNKLKIRESQKEKLQQQLQQISLEEQKKQKEQKRNQEIQKVIFQSLLSNPCSLDDLTQHLKKKGFVLSRDKVYKYLNIIKANITNIKGPSFEQLPPLYMIDKHPLPTPNPFYLIAPSEEVLELLCISDLHITSSEDLSNITYLMDKVYNYATLNNISYIINLGNTIEYQLKYPLHNCSLEDVKKIETFLETIAHDLPHDQNIYQLFLGGNKDKSFLQLGIDPLNKLNQYYSNYINLGYNHASVKLGKNLNQYLTFHYPEQYSPYESTETTFSVTDYVNSYYATNLKDKKDSYIELIGGTNTSKIDCPNHYCQVPSLTSDKISNRAWHLKIYLDQANNNINHITFMPLIMSDKLIPVAEISYNRRQKTKKD